MSLVGEIILGAREMFGDPPVGVLAAPGNEMTVTRVAVLASTLPAAGNYFVKLTYRTQYGETLPSPESGAIGPIDATHGIQVAGTPPVGITSVVAYFGTATQLENQNVVIPVASLPFNIVMPGNPASVPVRNTCYLPDSDGRVISVFALYRWINECLETISKLCGGGIPDTSGAGTVSGQPLYTFPGNWIKISNAWYDGYPLYLARNTDIFRRNKVTGVSGGLSVSKAAQSVIGELWPQPSRTSGQTTLAGNGGFIFPSSQSANLATSNFVLGFGYALIGTEIVSFATNNGGVLSGMIRGLGGTQPQTWPDGTAVTELNLMIYGLRVPSTFLVGQGSAIFDVPPGWNVAVNKYLLHRFRDAEKDRKNAQSLYQEFTALVQQLRMIRPIAGPVQIQAGAGRGAEVYPGLGGPFGGVIVP